MEPSIAHIPIHMGVLPVIMKELITDWRTHTICVHIQYVCAYNMSPYMYGM